MVGITFLFFLLVGFVFLVLVVAAVADWLLGLSHLNISRDGDDSVRPEPPDDGYNTSVGCHFGGVIDAGAGSLFGGCDPGAGGIGGCDAGGAAGGDGGC